MKVERIFINSDKMYFRGCPVVLCSSALNVVVPGNALIAQMKLYNVSEKSIRAVGYIVKCLDIYGNYIGDISGHIERTGGKYAFFGDDVPINVDKGETRSFKVEINDVLFNDGTVWKNEDKLQLEPMDKPFKIADYLGDKEAYAEFVKTVNNWSIDQMPHEEMGVYVCGCGTILRSGYEKCIKCGYNYSDYQKLFATDFIGKRRAEQKEKAAKRKTIIQTALVIGITIAVIAVASVLILRITKPVEMFDSYGELKVTNLEYHSILQEELNSCADGEYSFDGDKLCRDGEYVGVDTYVIDEDYQMITLQIDKDIADVNSSETKLIRDVFGKVTMGARNLKTASEAMDELERSADESDEEIAWINNGEISYELTDFDVYVINCWVEF